MFFTHFGCPFWLMEGVTSIAPLLPCPHRHKMLISIKGSWGKGEGESWIARAFARLRESGKICNMLICPLDQ